MNPRASVTAMIARTYTLLLAPLLLAAACSCRGSSAEGGIVPVAADDEDRPQPAPLGPAGPLSAGESLEGAANADSRPTFGDRLRAIARVYERYGRIEARARWAPMPCAPSTGWNRPAGELHWSGVGDETAHGRKLYYLFASFRSHYLGEVSRDDEKVVIAPIGQTVVKEAWKPAVVEGHFDDRDALPPDHARDGDRVYRTGAKVGLYIMTKLDPKTPGTDEGWLYGIVAEDGATVIESGRIERCMSCHKNAQPDRLFGFDR
jgi:hypothetical protein